MTDTVKDIFPPGQMDMLGVLAGLQREEIDSYRPRKGSKLRWEGNIFTVSFALFYRFVTVCREWPSSIANMTR